MPQRMTNRTPEKSHPMPQRVNFQQNSPIAERSHPMPQRMNFHRNSPLKQPNSPLLEPQRLNISRPNRNLSPLSKPQRLNIRSTPEKYPMPQRLTSDTMKTPEMPILKSVNFSPSTNRRSRRSPSPKKFGVRSHSTPPVMKRPEPPKPTPKVFHEEPNPQRPTITVNGQAYFVVERIGKGGSSEVFQVNV